ncbi:synapse differentiation-inducing gene protein 1 isoform 1-T2 [Menidia menidia]
MMEGAGLLGAEPQGAGMLLGAGPHGGECCETTFIEGLSPDSPPRKELLLVHTLSHQVEDQFQELESEYSSQSESEDGFLVLPPRDHWGLSLFSMLCCFWPFGIAAFYLSHQTHRAVSAGDLRRAGAISRRALFLAVLSVSIGAGLYVGVAVAMAAYLSRNHRR